MGADFMYAYTPIRGGRSEWIEIAKSAEVSDLRDILEDRIMDYLVEDMEDEEQVRAAFVDAINTVWDAIENRNREVARIQIDGETCLITGGMSWGETPTDIFDPIVLYAEFQDWFTDKRGRLL